MSNPDLSTDPRLAMFSLKPDVAYIDEPSRTRPVYLRRISGADRISFFSLEEDKSPGAFAREQHVLLAMCLCDENGKRLFRDDEAAVVSQKDATLIDVLVKRALQINGMGADAAAVAQKKTDRPVHAVPHRPCAPIQTADHEAPGGDVLLGASPLAQAL